jgi:23S rRNA pseudouridine1911/1915/1917 synthase
MCDFEVLYEDGPCLVVCKPPGLLTQAPPGIDSLEVQVRRFLQSRQGTGEVYLGLPHRLDRPASGAMLLATDLRTTRKLGRQFENRRVRKVYWALVEGRITPETGTWEDNLYKIPGEPRAEVDPPGHPGGRAAVLHYRVLNSGRGSGAARVEAAARSVAGEPHQIPCTWLEIELATGRTHQIRVQAASRGHPLLGDVQYGAREPFGPAHDDWRMRAIGLHARSISFRHPLTHQLMTVTAPLPDYWPPLEELNP